MAGDYKRGQRDAMRLAILWLRVKAKGSSENHEQNTLLSAACALETEQKKMLEFRIPDERPPTQCGGFDPGFAEDD